MLGARQESVACEEKFAVSTAVSRSQEGLLGIVTTRVFVLGPRRRGEFYEPRVRHNRSRRGRPLQLQSASNVAAERGRTASSTPLG